jgi:acetolactate synthase-1/3 small subunit
VAENSMTIEITGDESKVKGAEKLLTKFGIKELVRTGKIALQRGSAE